RRPPPPPPLFPYTTLFRSQPGPGPLCGDHARLAEGLRGGAAAARPPGGGLRRAGREGPAAQPTRRPCARHRRGAAGVEGSVAERSEEHTSELQSLAYLVCR